MVTTGLLCSQIGYDLQDPMQAVIRSTSVNAVPENSVFEVVMSSTDEIVFQGTVAYWGEIWKSSWWILDFTGLDQSGNFFIRVKAGNDVFMSSEPFMIGKDLLWHETIRPLAIEQLEERARQARNGIGWKDCGSDWREANSHATTVIGLCDLWSSGYKWLEHCECKKIAEQIIQGCDYLVICQDKAHRLGYTLGSIVHEIPNWMLVIPGDIAQSAVAFAKASRLLADTYPSKSDEYLQCAVNAYECFMKKTQPYGQEGFSHWNHGAPGNFNVPKEHMTRDLFMILWAAIELWKSGRIEYKEDTVFLASKILARQVSREKGEGELYGHLYTFSNCDFTEKSNCHHHVGHDTGSTFPQYILPLIELHSRWIDHPDKSKWEKAILDFAYGYFLPACSNNPFYLLPEGYFKDQGLLWFCGPWHGINVSYGFAAALAVKLEEFTGDKEFRKISVGNIQWIAGLNAGVTQDSFNSCYFWQERIEPGTFSCFSQIHGIGKKSVGCWTGIKGTIVNGFSVNPQFKIVVPPTKENDGPWNYTDEDWIPHSAGWMSALAALMDRKNYPKNAYTQPC